MTFTVEIEDNTKTGRSILQLLKDLSKTNKGIYFLETVEDDELLKEMKQSLKSGRTTAKEVNKTLGKILS